MAYEVKVGKQVAKAYRAYAETKLGRLRRKASRLGLELPLHYVPTLGAVTVYNDGTGWVTVRLFLERVPGNIDVERGPKGKNGKRPTRLVVVEPRAREGQPG